MTNFQFLFFSISLLRDGSVLRQKTTLFLLFRQTNRQKCKCFDLSWSFWSAWPLQHGAPGPTNHDPGDVASRGRRKTKKRVLHFGRLNSQIVMQWTHTESSGLSVAKSFAGRLWTVKHERETVIYRLKVRTHILNHWLTFVKFFWIMTSELPFSDSFLVIQAKQAKSNQQAIAQYESQPFRIQKKNTRCFSFRHLMRAKVNFNLDQNISTHFLIGQDK